MNFAALKTIDGAVRFDMVLRDDGAFVIAGFQQPEPDAADEEAHQEWADARAAFLADQPDTVAYLNWLAAGNTLAAAVPTPVPVVVPDSATRLGLMRALREAGKWDAAKQAIASNADVQEEWDLAISIKRDDPLTAGIIAALGLTSADVDKLLIQAEALTA